MKNNMNTTRGERLFFYLVEGQARMEGWLACGDFTVHERASCRDIPSPRKKIAATVWCTNSNTCNIKPYAFWP